MFTDPDRAVLKAVRDAVVTKPTVTASTTGSVDIPGGTLATLAALYSRPAITLTPEQITSLADQIAVKVPAGATAAEIVAVLGPYFAAIPPAVITEQKKPGN